MRRQQTCPLYNEWMSKLSPVDGADYTEHQLPNKSLE